MNKKIFLHFTSFVILFIILIYFFLKTHNINMIFCLIKNSSLDNIAIREKKNPLIIEFFFFFMELIENY